MSGRFCSDCGKKLIVGDLGRKLCPRCDEVGYQPRLWKWQWIVGGIVLTPIFLVGLFGWLAILRAALGVVLGF